MNEIVSEEYKHGESVEDELDTSVGAAAEALNDADGGNEDPESLSSD